MPEISQPQPYLELSIDAQSGAIHLQLQRSFRHRWTVLFGPSGSGKSSILRALCGLWGNGHTSVLLHGESLNNLPTHLRRIALLSQQAALFPHWTALQNVRFALESQRLRSTVMTDAAMQWLKTFHADQLALRKVTELSAGEQQRVALARAVASQPRLLLLDEAFSGLDTPLREELVEELQQWQISTGVPVISVTHDVAEALGCAAEVVSLIDGHVTMQGPPREVLQHQLTRLMKQLK